MAKNVQSFNAEIKQLLDLMIHSLYSNKEIFLRELISNASDAIDKRKFAAITDSKLAFDGGEYFIRLEPHAETKTLKIIDTGIGMSHDEVIQFIGTIARSGTKNFLKMSEDIKSRPELIGQFGVGFYSSFMVADKVTLHTQKAGSTEGVLWESTGDGTYSVDDIPRAEGTGTTITLHLKDLKEAAGTADQEDAENNQDFTDPWTLKSLVKKYSDFISHPIHMKGEKEDETLNSQKALWLRSPSEIKSEEYTEFYKQLTYDWNEPAKTIHYRAEGTIEFNSLMYIPSKKPFNYYFKDTEYGLNLYVKRVFIMNDCKNLLPTYLRFVRGLVDSSDLSLNVSREILQQDRQVTQIRKNVVNKILGTLKEMLTKDRPAYENFWKEFGPTLKEGVPAEPTSKEKLQELLLFYSSAQCKMITLEEYVQNMKAEQKQIYFITGENIEQLSLSPYLEKLKDKGYDVLFLVDPIDEWVTQSITEFKEKKLQSITREGLEIDTEEEKKQKEEEKKQATEKYQSLIDHLKNHLGTFLKDVIVSDRLTQSPVCLVTGEHDSSARMERIMSQAGKDYQQKQKRIMEINPKHPVIEKMLTLDEKKRGTWAEVLYGQALLNEGSALPDPGKFSHQIAEVMLG